MSDAFLSHILATLDDIEAAGLTKRERLLTGPQGGRIRVASPKGSREAVNLCANNYLGLANHPDVVAAARRAMDEFGFGMASVRFICGAQTLHRELEQAIARHLGKDDAIVFAACFDANGGVFEPLLDEADAIVSDSLNHASIIDGVRLSKAQALPLRQFGHERARGSPQGGGRRRRALQAHRHRRRVLDGRIRRQAQGDLRARRPLWRAGHGRRLPRDRTSGREGARHACADRRGRTASTSSPERSARRWAAAWAASSPRRSRSSIFCASGRGPISSPTRLAPPIAAGALKALEIVIEADDRRALLQAHARRFRAGVEKAGFKVLPGETPIIPVMLGDARLAQGLAQALDERGVFVAGFFFPVVPKGEARIRTQMSAALTTEDDRLCGLGLRGCGQGVGNCVRAAVGSGSRQSAVGNRALPRPLASRSVRRRPGAPTADCRLPMPEPTADTEPHP